MNASVSPHAHANGRYVTAEAGGSQPLIANRTAIGPWEEFDRPTGPTSPTPHTGPHRADGAFGRGRVIVYHLWIATSSLFAGAAYAADLATP